MGVTSILSLLSGVALFLYGMSVMGDSLKKVAGNKLELILYKLTSTPLKGILLGTAVTAIIQSSSATTVMVVGFVNSGMMKVAQSIGIIMGANIGTSVTGWILCLSYIEGSGGIAQLLSTATISAVVAIIGIIFRMVMKKDSYRHVGEIMLGFAILMFGMQTMSGAVAPLKDSETFRSMLTMFTNPAAGILVGILFTAVLQSASASVGILQALSVTGGISFAVALPIVMGIGVGAACPVLMSAIGTNKNGKRTALIYLLNDLFGMLFWSIVFYTLNAIFHFKFMNVVMTPVYIALMNTVFRAATICILSPFIKYIEKLVYILIKDDEEDLDEQKDFDLLEERFLNYPAIAIAQSHTAMNGMARKARKNLSRSVSLLKKYSDEKYQKIEEKEVLIDKYEDKLGSYLVKVGNCDLSRHDNHTFSILLHCMSDFERISDHAINIAKSAKKMNSRESSFSQNARKELETFAKAVHDIVGNAVQVFENQDIEAAKHIEPLEQVIDGLNLEIKQRHINRLRKGRCTIETGLILEDIMTNFERVSDHCSNIAVCMIEVRDNGFETHGYLEHLTNEDNPQFAKECRDYYKQYQLPELKKAD